MGFVATGVVVGSLLAVVVTLVVGVFAWRNRSVRGAEYLALLALVSSGEALAYSVTLLAGRESTLVGLRVYRSFLAVGGVLWLAFAATWTDNRWVLSRRYFWPIAGLHLLVVPVVWADAFGLESVHDVWWTEAGTTTVDGLVLPATTYGPAYGWWRLYSALVFLSGTALVVQFALRPEQRLYRRQNLLLVFGVAFAFALSVAFRAAGSPFDPTPLGIAVANVLAVVAIFGYGFFDVVPVARRNVVQEVDTGMVVYDGNGTLVDANSAAVDLLDVSDEQLGRDLREVLSNSPGVDLDVDGESLAGGEPLGELLDGVEVTVESDGRPRYFDASVSELTDSAGRHVGHAVLFYEVTAQRRRERELDVLKQVLARVLRHNVRNDLTVIQGHAELIEAGNDPEEHAGPIIETSRDIAETSRKAHTIRQVLDRQADPRPVELTEVIATLVERIQERYPGATVETHLPETAWAVAIPGIDVAVENLVENAVEHGSTGGDSGPDDGTPRVRVGVECGDERVEVTVADDGPGIPQHEVDVLEHGEETALDHGSGIGLWIVDLIVERSGGSVHFEASDRGTEATVRLSAATQGGDGDEG